MTESDLMSVACGIAESELSSPAPAPGANAAKQAKPSPEAMTEEEDFIVVVDGTIKRRVTLCTSHYAMADVIRMLAHRELDVRFIESNADIDHVGGFGWISKDGHILARFSSDSGPRDLAFLSPEGAFIKVEE